jgi:hypothetical protein
MAKVWLPGDQWAVFEALAKETIKGGDPLVTRPPGASTSEAPKGMIA